MAKSDPRSALPGGALSRRRAIARIGGAGLLFLLLAACQGDGAAVQPAARAAPAAAPAVAPASPSAAAERQPVGATQGGQTTQPVRLEEINPQASQQQRDQLRGGARPGSAGGLSIEAPSPWGVMPGGARRP